MDYLLEYFKDNSLSIGIGGIGVLAVGLGIFRYRKWVGGGVCYSKARLTGKTAIITGANTGLGFETAVDLAKRGARVVLACRNEEKGEKAAVSIRRRTGNQDVVFIKLDLASLKSVRVAAESILKQEQRIDILINNAGLSLSAYEKTEDGFEAHFGVNHLGHFLLTNLLLPRMKECPSARIITVSSSLYKKCSSFNFADLNSSNPANYSPRMPGAAYSRSKLANILFSRSLSKHLEGTSVCTYAVHPGVIFRTELSRDFLPSLFKWILLKLVGYLLLKTPWQGAQTTIFCAVAEELEGVSGHYYGDCREEPLTPVACNDDLAEEFWRSSAELVGVVTQ